MNNYNKFILEFIKVLKKILKNKKNFLHEPYLDFQDQKIVSNAIETKEISTSANSYYRKFQKQLKKFTKSKNIFLTSSGTNALYLAIKGMGIKNDTEVMLSSLGFVASLNTILYANCIPHFLDCSKDNYGVDYKKLKKFLEKSCKLNSQNECINLKSKKKVSAIIITHVYGFPAEVDAICKLCKKYSIKVIEDAAESLGSLYKNKHLGTFGDIGILSFNGNKIITTGAGGAVLTNNKKYYKKISHIGNLARVSHPYEIDFNNLGFNYKMPNLNASLGYSQFKKLKDFIKYKKKLNQIYQDRFFKFKKYFKLKLNNQFSNSNFWLQSIVLEDSRLRNKLIKSCIKNNIYIKPIWKPLHKIKYVKKKFCQNNMENTNYLEKRIISLPSGIRILKKNI